MTNLTDLFPAVPTYTPAMMEFDGSSGYYNKGTLTTTGNKVTAIASFECGTQAATAYVMYLTATHQRCAVLIDTAGKVFCVSANSVNTVICRLITANSYDDGLRHTVMYSFDADTGVAILIVDGISDIDTGHGSYVAPTTGTLSTGASGSYNVGASNVPANYLNGQIGFCGHREAYLTNWSDFFYTDGSPRQLDTIGWTQWNAGTFQTPMMTFDGSTAGYVDTYTSAGNKESGVVRFSRSTFSTNDYEVIYSISDTYQRLLIIVFSDDYAAATLRQGRVQMQVMNSAGTVICRLISPVVTDGNVRTLKWEFDGDTGQAVFFINGVDADQTGHADRIAPTTGTLETGSMQVAVGYWGASGKHFEGDIGFCGHRDTSDLDWSDFMQADGTPKEIDEIGWKQWGGQPLFWNKGGLMTDNAGSAGVMTKNGTITGPSGGWPLFWNEHGQGSNNQGSAGDMTENGLIVVGNGGN